MDTDCQAAATEDIREPYFNHGWTQVHTDFIVASSLWLE